MANDLSLTDRLQTMSDALPALMAIIDRDLRYEFVNAAYGRYFGLSLEAIRGKSPRDVIGGNVFEKVRGQYEKALSGVEVTFEVEVDFPAMGKQEVRVTLVPRRDAAGDINGFHVLVSDLVERNLADRRYRNLLESAPDAMVIADGTGQIVLVNAQFERLFGYSRNQVLGQPVEKLIPHRYCDAHRSHRQRYCEQPHARPMGVGMELSALHKDGSEFPVEISLSPMQTSEGLLVSTAIRDVTEQRKTQRELREHEQKLKRLIETTSIIPWEANAETWQFTYVGPQAAEILGYPIDHWYEDDFWVRHIHPDDRESAVDFCLKASKELDNYEFDYRMITRDGRSVWLHDIVNVEFADGAPKMLRGFLLDITDRKQADDRLRQSEHQSRMLARRLLTAQEDERRRLARELHDGLTQELAALAMDVSTIRSGTQEVAQDLDSKLTDIATRIRRLSTEVRDLSRHLHPAILEDLGLAKAIESECAAFSKRTGIQATCRSSFSIGALALDRGLALFRVVQEGLRNVELHSQTRSVQIRLDQDAGAVILRVQDDGVGFQTESHNGQFGLGLTSMRERVSFLGGGLKVESQSGKGTTLTACLPIVGRLT